MKKIAKPVLGASALLFAIVATGVAAQAVQGTESGAAAGAWTKRAKPVQVFDAGEDQTELRAKAKVLKSVQDPAELATALDGTQPNSFIYLLVPGVNFQPKDNSTTVTYQGGGCISTNGGQVIAQLPLPDNAVVKYLRLYYDRALVGQSSTAYFTRYQPSTQGALDVFSVSASGTGLGTILSAEQSHVVDYFTYGYQAIWWGTGAVNNQFCGVRVAYYSPPNGTYTAVTPCRRIDTRSTNPPNLTPVPRDFQITGGCGVPTGATAVTANITTDQTTTSSYMAIWPQGGSWSGTSNLNWTAGQIVANAAVLVLGPTGQITAGVSTGSAALILDITGYFY